MKNVNKDPAILLKSTPYNVERTRTSTKRDYVFSFSWYWIFFVENKYCINITRPRIRKVFKEYFSCMILLTSKLDRIQGWKILLLLFYVLNMKKRNDDEKRKKKNKLQKANQDVVSSWFSCYHIVSSTLIEYAPSCFHVSLSSFFSLSRMWE